MEFNINNFDAILEKTRILSTKEYIQAPIILKSDSTPIATLGNISASVGKAKSGKTFNVVAIASAILADNPVLNYSANLPSDKKNIIYIDTEQSEFHCQKTVKRIATLSKISDEEMKNRLYFFALRKFNADQRKTIIDEILSNINNVGFVIIDGLRDLLHDFNCPKESSDLITKLMHWSSEYMLHIHTVLHVNKNDEQTRGHLGTELNNKAENIIHICKQNSTNTHHVKSLLSRDIEFMSFSFIINEDGIPVLDVNSSINIKQSKRGIKFDEITDEQHIKALVNAFSNPIITGYNHLKTSIRQAYSDIGFEFGNNKITGLIKYLKEHNFIINEGKGYQLNKK